MRDEDHLEGDVAVRIRLAPAQEGLLLGMGLNVETLNAKRI